MSECVEGRGVVSFLVICTCLLAMKDFLMGTNIRRGRFFSIYPSICLCMCPSPNTFPSSSFTGIISFFVYLLNPLPPHLSFLPPPHRWCPSCVAPLCRSCCCCQSQSSGPRSSCWCSASRSRYSTPSHPHHLATSCSSHGNRKEAKGERKREGRRGL